MRPQSRNQNYHPPQTLHKQPNPHHPRPSPKKKYEIAGTEFIVDSKYDIIKQIGSGAYGVVVSAIDRTNNKKYAIKKVVNAFDDLIDAKRIIR